MAVQHCMDVGGELYIWAMLNMQSCEKSENLEHSPDQQFSFLRWRSTRILLPSKWNASSVFENFISSLLHKHLLRVTELFILGKLAASLVAAANVGEALLVGVFRCPATFSFLLQLFAAFSFLLQLQLQLPSKLPPQMACKGVGHCATFLYLLLWGKGMPSPAGLILEHTQRKISLLMQIIRAGIVAHLNLRHRHMIILAHMCQLT